MDKDVEVMLYRLYDVVNTPHDDVRILPCGNRKPEEVLKWLDELSDEEFSLLMKTPIIHQAKHFYTKVRKQLKGE